MSRKTRHEVREAKREYKEAKSELKTTKQKYKLEDTREKRLVKSQPEPEKRYLGQKRNAKRKEVNKEIEALKQKKAAAKAKLRQAIQRNGGSTVQKVGREVHKQVSSLTDKALSENEDLEDVSKARKHIRNSHAHIRKGKAAGRYTLKVGKQAVKGAYSLGNRTYNLARGRGFTRTAVNKRWETKLTNKYQRLRARLRVSKAGKGLKAAKKVTSTVAKPLMAVLKNPLSAKAYVIMLIVFLLLALLGLIAGGGSSTVSQNEFDLTDTWIHLSKLDREKSTDEVDYWTNIDDIMMFMGYKHEDYTLDSKYDEKDKQWYEIKHSYRELLTDLWDKLNGDKDNLKTMADIYKSTDNKYLKLSTDEIKEYDEVLEQAKEVGYYVIYNDLANPFTKESNVEESEPIKISKRFGYTSKTKMYNGSVLQANQGDHLYAVMDGTAQVKGSDLIIKTESAEFTYKDVSRLRIKDGATVKTGEEIGAVKSTSGQEVYYQKLKNKDKKEWAWVNVGFYLPKVEYTQSTSVMTDMNIEGNVAEKISAIYNYLKKQDDKVTKNGVAAMLGNFWTESSINPKRAEGDYLSPPIGASASSWDDPNWLSIGGPAIYNGSYPNIVHRGLGLGQWTDTQDGSTRHTALLEFAKSKNKKWYDLELQMDFMLHGDSPYYIKILNEILHSNDNVNNLTYSFLVYWEGNPGDKLKERQNNANQVLSYLNNPTASGTTRGGSKTLQSSWNFPSEYTSKLTTYPSSATLTSLNGNTYPIGQCTWYVYNRLVEAGVPHYNWLGHGQYWVKNLVAKGWTFSDKPVAGAVMSTAGGFDYTGVEYGHVSYVEYVNEDGSFLVSECNFMGVQNQIHWAVKRNAHYYTFAIPPK